MISDDQRTLQRLALRFNGRVLLKRPSAEQPRVLQPLEIGQVAQRLEAEHRQEILGSSHTYRARRV